MNAVPTTDGEWGRRITLRPSADKITRDNVREHGPSICCDFYIQGIERTAEALPWGFRDGDLENLDHHAPEARFEHLVSSANLAITRVQAVGVAPDNVAVVINHTDCDSILSSAIVAGLLDPDERYGAAAIAADHSGEPNAIADLLQSLDRQRNIELSLRSLAALERGSMLPDIAVEKLAIRLSKRDAAEAAVAEGRFQSQDGVMWAKLDFEIDGEFFPRLMPDAKVIVISYPNLSGTAPFVMKARLGLGAPEGMSLHQLDIKEHVDPAYGGRWDAGSTRRGKGTVMGVEEWALKLAARMTSQ